MMEKSNLRPPVVAILGHVDHGKTTLLDKIRNTNLTAREAGGITQSIGAWSVTAKSGKKITFIDTPGHEAFMGMRARGAKIADLAVLVVAADDGVMPQTKQSIQFIKESQTPFLVAITKVDLQTAQVDKVKNQLLELEIVPEDLGGDVVTLQISSKTGQGIEELVEMILLVSDMHAISGSPRDALEAYVLEAQKDARRGIVTSVVTKKGTLKVGDLVTAEGVKGKIRGLFDQDRKSIKVVGPGAAAEIIGFAALPQVGALLTHESSRTSQEIKESFARRETFKVEGFPIMIKADTSGSLEAILGQLGSEVGIVSSSLGDLIEADVAQATATGATIIGFNVKAGQKVLKLAEEEKVKVYTYTIIYELLADIARWIKEASEESLERILGRAQIIAQFPHTKTERIAGVKVIEGRMVKTDKVRIKRGEVTLGQIKINSIRKQKLEVERAAAGDECGILFSPQFDFEPGDVLESVL